VLKLVEEEGCRSGNQYTSQGKASVETLVSLCHISSADRSGPRACPHRSASKCRPRL